jgi:hypothetical protein
MAFSPGWLTVTQTFCGIITMKLNPEKFQIKACNGQILQPDLQVNLGLWQSWRTNLRQLQGAERVLIMTSQDRVTRINLMDDTNLVHECQCDALEQE